MESKSMIQGLLSTFILTEFLMIKSDFNIGVEQVE